MMGVQDFCGHYEWTFSYIERVFGEEALQRYWSEAIAFDSQRHAYEKIREKGFEGMEDYWGHTLTMEKAGYVLTRTNDLFRIDMHACPSKGFLIDHGLEQFADYCEHCMGWIGPVMEKAGFRIDHEHNHLGQCWWEMKRKGTSPDKEKIRRRLGEKDVTLSPEWGKADPHRYRDSRKVDS